MAHLLLLSLLSACDSDTTTTKPDPPRQDADTDTDTDTDADTDTDSDTDADTDTDTDTDTAPDCPDGVVCVVDFPSSHTSTTTGAEWDRFDSYGCAPSTDESGPEVLYRVTLPEDGFLGLELDEGSMGAGADVDIHLLASRDADDCISRGHWRAGGLLPAGTYWVAADTWVTSDGDEQDGAYTLRFGLTTADALVGEGMDRAVAEDALHAYDVAWSQGDADHFGYAVTDFSMHAGERRQWVMDMATGEVLWTLYVAHGEGSASRSDDGVADTFSDTNNSHQSSLGMVRAAEIYTGSFGYSMRLDGLEAGYNGSVRSRAIVVHPWEGSREEYVRYYGAAANTWGCPALDDRISADVIDFLADGGLLLFHYDDGDWSRSSAYLP